MMYYAHSSDKKRGVLNPQLYFDHVDNVYNESKVFLVDALKHSTLKQSQIDFMIDVLSLASYYHDLGKLDNKAQYILSADYDDDNDKKMINHVDAGAACLLNKYEKTKNLAYLISAFLVHAHHRGLKNQDVMAPETLDTTNKQRATYYYPINVSLFRDCRDILETYGISSTQKTVKEYIDANLYNYEKTHLEIMEYDYIPKTNITRKIPVTAFQIRLMLSCLVDADHTDTDTFYSRQWGSYQFNDLQIDKRFDKLQEFTKVLSSKPNLDVSTERLNSRKELHSICLSKPIPDDISFFALDGSVGLGKTLSGLTYALRLAKQRNVDRIYNIIPFTNIISQTVMEYRKAILLSKEDKNNINEIHSKCEFDKIWMRKYSNRWNAPINVSTAVQFFESLVSKKPSRLRKLHWFANSVFFFDEYDKSMPHQYWQYILLVLKELTYTINCSYIFSSGTSAYYWDIFDESEVDVHDIIDKNTYQMFRDLEKKRIKTIILPNKISNINSFIKSVFGELDTVKSGLIVCNTIKNASILAELMRNNRYGYAVYELTGW